tara:strand:- start:211 stop:312 length:102 start_codon:yes stop_codon:yes gene_type:complete
MLNYSWFVFLSEFVRLAELHAISVAIPQDAAGA